MANNKGSKKVSNNSRKKSSNSSINDNKNDALVKELMIWITLIVSVILLLCVFGLCGPLNNVFGSLLFGLFGVAAYIFPILLFFLIALYYVNKNNKRVKSRILGGIGLYMVLAALVQLPYNDEVEKVWECYTYGYQNKAGGGFTGGCISIGLSAIMGGLAATIILVIIALMLFAFISGKLIASILVDKSADRYNRRAEDRRQKRESIRESHGESLDNRSYDSGSYDSEGRYVRKTYKFPDEAGNDKRRFSRSISNENPSSDNQYDKGKNAAVPSVIADDIHVNTAEYDDISTRDPFENVVIHRTDSDMPNFEKELLEKFGDDGQQVSKQSEPEHSTSVHSESVRSGSVQSEAVQSGSVQSEAVQSGSVQPEAVQSGSDQKEHIKQTISEEEVNIEMPPEPIPYQFPSIELLSRPKRGKANMSDRALKETALKLQECLKSFKVDVTMTDIICGPTVTRFELQPALGTRVKKITELENDIKLNLAAPDIRIEAPIPGKSAVGIEVPNTDNVLITLREMLETDEFLGHKSNVAFAVGKDISGKNIIADIAKMPHLLIAGSTGSGKSVCINTIVMSIIYKADPNDVKLIMVDPKVVELSVYNGIPHLCIPVVTDPKKAAAALNWAVAEMNDRYSKFAELGVRDMVGFNKKVESMKNKNAGQYQKMPQIVIIVDELADLMMVASHDVETAICRLAQMARAAGLHLIIATQRPSVDVITGLIKANVPSRIAFAVSSSVDSRTILDGAGAEKLLGKGDMLYFPQGIPKPVRVQGAFVSDSDVAKVASFIKNQYTESVYDESINEKIKNVELSTGKGGAAQSTAIGEAEDEDGRDPLFADAGRYIIEKEKASIGNLQRVFKIGFNRGARIMDQLCEAGVVSEEDGKKPRNILMTMEQFEQFLMEGKVG